MTDDELGRIPGRARVARDAHPHSATVAVLAGDIGVLVAEVRRLRAEASYQVAVEWRRKCEALEQFKAYVHSRLDAAGVPADPESPHKAEGCRIGGRLDAVFVERDALRLEVQHLRALDAAARKELERFAARVAELEAALRPFAAWYAKFGDDGIDPAAVPAYRRAAELLKGDAP